jgi:hypothetical protein
VIHLEILPPPQRAFWEEDLATLPAGWVLYGGTAVALHLGHRRSRDFDFFSSNPLDRFALRRSCRLVAEAKTLQDEPDTLTGIIHEDVARAYEIAVKVRNCRGGARVAACEARGYPRPEGPWVAAIQWRESPRRSNDADPASLGARRPQPAVGRQLRE